ITPYTSFLVTDDVAGKLPMGVNGNQQLFLRRRFAKGFGGGAGAPAKTPAEKRDRVNASRSLGKARRGAAKGSLEGLDAAADDAVRKEGRARSSLSAIRYIGSRTFFKSGNTWYDSTYNAMKDKSVTKVEIGSPAYFRLLKTSPRVAKYLALSNVILRVKGKWYHVAPKAKTKK
ncbi:MAG: hypothetical protein ACE5KM_15200, partial [Planctomycetaceae bacterium]